MAHKFFCGLIVLWKSIIEWSKEVFSHVHSVTCLSFVPEWRHEWVVFDEGNGFEQWWIKKLEFIDLLGISSWNWFLLRLFLSGFCTPQISFFFPALILIVHIESMVHAFWFSFLVSVHLVLPNFPPGGLFEYFLSFWTVAVIFNIRLLKSRLIVWASVELFLDFVNTFDCLLKMLALNDCRLVLLVHALYSLTSISIDKLIGWGNWVSDVNDFLFSEIFQVVIFCPFCLFRIFSDF